MERSDDIRIGNEQVEEGLRQGIAGADRGPGAAGPTKGPGRQTRQGQRAAPRNGLEPA